VGKSIGDICGGITGLLRLIDEHPGALQADLIALELRLRDCPSPQFDWRDLSVIVRHSSPKSHVFAALHPSKAGWDATTILIGCAVDYLAILVWAKTKDAQKGRNRPKSVMPWNNPTPRQGSKPKPAPLSEIRRRLARRNKPQQALNQLFGEAM
jgi:hypothetical protein